MEKIKFTNGYLIELPIDSNVIEQFGSKDDVINQIVSEFMSVEHQLIEQVLTQLIGRKPNHDDLLLCCFERKNFNEYLFFYDNVEIGKIKSTVPMPPEFNYDIVFTPHPAFC